MPTYLHGAYGHLAESIVQQSVTSETVPVYFGTAPIGLVRGWEEAGVVNSPVRISSLADAKAKIGYSPDFGSFTLSEAVAAHFDNGGEGVGPIYVVDVLDPSIHRKATETVKAVVFANGRAEIATDTAILDTLRIERPAVEGAAQAFAVRPDGSAGDDVPMFDYAEAYEAMGATLSADGVIAYEPTGEDAPELMHGDHYFMGIVFAAPDGATGAVMSVNGEAGDPLDLTQESDGVLNGDPIQYFAYADADGNPMDPASWVVSIAWTGGAADGTATACRISRGTADYVEGADYSLDYNANSNTIVLSAEDGGGIADGEAKVAYFEMDPDAVDADDVIGMVTADGEYSGIAALPLLYQEQFAVPNILAAPGWSDDPKVYAALVSACQSINGHWDAVIAVDLPLVDPTDGSTMVDTIAKAVQWKADHGYASERAVACWPMAEDASGRRFHVSTLWVAASQKVDQSNSGVPFESPSNKAVPIAKQFFGDNAKNRGFDQQTANGLNEQGIATVISWAGEQVLWGPHTAAYEWENPSVDPRANFMTNMRMLFHITNTFQAEWSPLIDEPMTRALRDRIVNREQEKLDALVTQGALIGSPRVYFLETENPNANVLQGDFRWDIAATVTPPLKSATVYVAYTDAGFSVYFEGGE